MVAADGMTRAAFWSAAGAAGQGEPGSRLGAGLRRLGGPAMILGASACFQISAALSVVAFAQLGVLPTAAMRYQLAAVMMVLLFRPRLRGRTRSDWALIVALGVTLAVMNSCYYEAIHRIPIGTASTLEFLGPLAVAIAGSRRAWHVALAGLAGIGVVLIAGPSLHTSAPGLLLGCLTGALLAGYILLSDRVGRRTGGSDGLTLAIVVAGLVMLPLSLPAAGSLDGPLLLRVIVAAIFGGALGLFLELRALRLTGPRTVGVLLSLDPALGAIVGLIALGQVLSPPVIAGMVLVVLAGMTTSATTPLPTPPSTDVADLV